MGDSLSYLDNLLIKLLKNDESSQVERAWHSHPLLLSIK